MFLINMTKEKDPMIGLSLEQATKHFERRPKVYCPAEAVISETARAPTKDRAEKSQGWVWLHKATNDTRPAPSGGPEYWARTPSKQELP